MSLLNKEDFCKGSVTGTIEDVENEIGINFEVFIPKQEYAHSDDDFEIYLNDIQDSDYNGEWTDNLEEVIYNSCFLETICDYAFASRTKENIYTDCSCKIYIESSTLEWDEKASENDAYFTSINTYGYDGMYKLLTKEEKIDEIEKIAEEIADLFVNYDIKSDKFASHMRESVEVDFITDDDINSVSYDNFYKELAIWYELDENHQYLNDLKLDIADVFDIQLIDENNNNNQEQALEDLILKNVDIETEDNIISEKYNNYKIDFDTAVKIVAVIIENEHLKSDNYYTEW